MVVVMRERGRISSILLTPAQGRSWRVVHDVEFDSTMWSTFRSVTSPLAEASPTEAPRERDCSSRLPTGGSYR